MESKTTVILPEDSADKKLIIPSASSADTPASANGNPANRTRRPIFSKLPQIMRPRRTVVDETMLIAAAVNPRLELFPPSRSTTAEDSKNLPELNRSYNLADKPFAAGGQGKLSTAEHRFLACETAIKSLHANQCNNPDSREAFFNEAQLTASLDHPAIIPVHGFFSDENNGLHLAMKLIKGCTLSEYLKRLTGLYQKHGIHRFDEKRSLRSRIDIFLRVCDAISFAHEKKILHRDLKPENIMLGKHRETYVTDWGIALPFADALKLKKVSGTPAYVAPELLSNPGADHKSDIYSLGVILFELTTLNPAFSDEDVPTLLQKVRLGNHNPLRHRFGSKIDRDLQAIIRKAMSVDPALRYSSVNDLARDLRKYLANEEVSARPDNIFNRLARWGSTHRNGMMLALLGLLLLLAGSSAYILHKEVVGSIRQRAREQAIHQIHSQVTAIAGDMEKSIQRVEYQLETLRINMLFTHLQKELVLPANERINLFTPERYRSDPPPSFRYSPIYRHKIDPDGAVIFNTRTQTVTNQEFEQYNAIGLHMQKILLATLPDRANAAPEALLTGSQPAKSVYSAWSNGIFIAYPGTDEFDSTYDPSARQWYINAIRNPDKAYWSMPYNDAYGNNEKVISCSLAVPGLHGELIGVAAMDFSLEKLSDALMSSPSQYQKFIYEKMLISPDGNVLFRTASENQPAVKFNDPELIKQMQELKYGTLTARTEQGEILLAFAHIKQLNILYVETVDINSLTTESQN
ncbi:MAG: hypothetical protein E7047_01520 [Lentisphaerae bacterium]|nr:hypothetical protein [Lentisphaerota bacterium]